MSEKINIIYNSPSQKEEDINYYSNGAAKSKYVRMDGELHGMTSWWYESGPKKRQSMFRRGKKHGVQTGWYESGKIEWEVFYVHYEECARIEWSKEGDLTKVYFLTP